MAGVPGFEPGNAEIKTRCLTAWRYPKNDLKQLDHISKNMAGVPGFEPGNAEIKTRCLTAWRYPNQFLLQAND